MPGFLRFVKDNAVWLLAGFLLTFASSFGQTFFIAVFAGEIRAYFGLSHGGWGGLYAFATMASAATMVFAGTLSDRFRVRVLGAAVLLGLALAALGMALATHFVVLVVAIYFLRLFGQGFMGHIAMVAMARWFVATRGRAVSIAGLGVATGEAFLPIVVVALLGLFDWRMLWIAAGLILIAFVPVLYLLLGHERTPQSFAADRGSQGFDGRMWTRGEVFRHRFFWLMVPALLGPSAWMTVFFFHQVHLAEAKDWAHLTLVALFPLFTGTSVVFLLIAGWFVDRFGCAALARIYLAPIVLGYLAFAVAPSPTTGAVAIMLMGASTGMHTTLMATLWAEVYGTRHLGAIRAMIAAVMVLGTALGPAISGALIDLGIALPTQFFGIAAYFAAAAALVIYATLTLQTHRGNGAQPR
ncbi:MAG: MFS transporter [Salinarimonas sp.]|nr:MFS transporter [Salinarimonas sp.]